MVHSPMDKTANCYALRLKEIRETGAPRYQKVPLSLEPKFSRVFFPLSVAPVFFFSSLCLSRVLLSSLCLSRVFFPSLCLSRVFFPLSFSLSRVFFPSLSRVFFLSFSLCVFTLLPCLLFLSLLLSLLPCLPSLSPPVSSHVC